MSEDKASPARPVPMAEVPGWDDECDVLIVGYGGSGACAAIEAADAGARVLILEVASGPGGTTALSSSEIYMGGNGGTPPQRSAGFNDDTEDMFRYMMRASGPNADEAKVRLYCENSLAHFDWLVSIGVPFKNSFFDEKVIIHMTDDCLLYSGNEEAHPFREEAKPCPRGHKPQIEGDNGGTLLVETLTRQVGQRPGIKVCFDSRALSCIVDEHRRVQGLVARMDGQQRYLRAKRGVILCAGGFIMNKQMVEMHAPKLLRTTPIGNPGDDGSGIRIGIGAGGRAINMGEGFVSLPYYPPASLVTGIMVNSQGQRFINEDCYHGRVGEFALRQPGEHIYLITDSENFGRPDPAMQIELCATGETIAELEEELKLVPGSLESTVAVFNRYAAKGEDPLFHKHPKFLKALDKPPFAALDCSFNCTYYPGFTLGGLDTLPSGEVLDNSGEIIPGLYAAGRNSCGLPRSGSGYSSGMSVGDATFFGRMAGRSAAGAEATA